jgi:serralysin
MPGTAIGSVNDGTPTNGANLWIDALTWGGRWIDDPAAPTPDGATTITYAAVSGVVPTSSPAVVGTAWAGPALTALQAGYAAWSNVANIQFVQSTATDPIPANEVDIWNWQLSDADMGGFLGFSEVPGTPGTFEPLYTSYNRDVPEWSTSGLAKGGQGYVTILHEIGHSLGLAHPHDGGDGADANLFPGVTSEFGSYGDFNLNQGIFTTMSYNDGWQTQFPTHADMTYGWQAGPMALDIAAIQAIYGANSNFNNTETTYILPMVNAAGTFWTCIWDTGGIDTISNADSTIGATIDLREAPLVGANAGGYISSNAGIIGGFTIANGALIENAIGGSGVDTLVGNDAANTLDGGADSVVDTLNGGLGNDTFVFGANTIADTIVDAGGVDTVLSSLTRSIATLSMVENLTLTGTAAANATGNALANVLTGNSGVNVLDGGVDAIVDTLDGGEGHDIYVMSNAVADTIIDVSGTDTVQSTVTRTIAGLDTATLQIENLTLTGAAAANATGNSLNNAVTGNIGLNTLVGFAGNDTLDGGTDALVDTLDGGLGDDIFIMNNVVADTILDSSGVDRVESTVTRTLAGMDTVSLQIENLLLTGAAAINGTGNSLNNIITGNSAANTLDGGAGNDLLDGGLGVDSLLGGAGNDTIIFDALDSAANINGGTDYDVLRIIGNSLPGIFNLAAAGFEHAQWLETDTTGQSWATRVSEYNQNWQAELVTTQFDSGARRTLANDYTAGVVWSSLQQDFNPTGVQTYQKYVFDNNSSRDTTFDNTAAIVWKSLRQDYDAAGTINYQYYVFDNNASRDTTFDSTAGIVWKSLRQDYDIAGALNYQYYVFDNNASRDTSYDNTAGIVWKSLRQDYNAAGTINYQYYVFDNNASRDTTFDNTAGIVWKSLRQDYDTAGALNYQYYVFDNNASRDTSYDNTEGIVWKSLRQDYDAAGTINYQYYVFDNNASRDTTFDNTAGIVWKSLRQDYDAAGVRTYLYYVFDNDTTRSVSTDQTAAVVWQTLRQDYNAAGALTYQFYNFDNGTSRSVAVDADNLYSWATQTTNYDTAGNVVNLFYT